MRTLRRNLGRGLGLLALLVVGLAATAAAGWLSPLNHWIERRLLAELRVLGVETDTTHLRELSWRRAVIGPVVFRLPGLALSAEEARAELGWRVLAQRATPQVVLSGLVLEVQADRLGELREALQPQSGGFPYGRVTIERSRLVVRRGAERLELPFTAEIESRVEALTAELVVDAPVLSGRFTVRGDLGEDGLALEVHEGRLQPAAWMALGEDQLPPEARALAFAPAAQLQFSGTATLAAGRCRAAAGEVALPAMRWSGAGQTLALGAGRLVFSRDDAGWRGEWRPADVEWVAGERHVRATEPLFALESGRVRLRRAHLELTAPALQLQAEAEAGAERTSDGLFAAEAQLRLTAAAADNWRLAAPAEVRARWTGNELNVSTEALGLAGPMSLQLAALELVVGGWQEAAPRLRAQAQIGVDTSALAPPAGVTWRLDPAVVGAKATINALLASDAPAARIELSVPAQRRTLVWPGGRAEAALGGEALLTLEREFFSGRASFELRDFLGRVGERSLLAPEATLAVRWPRTWMASWVRPPRETGGLARALWWAGDYDVTVRDAVVRAGAAGGASGVTVRLRSRGAELYETGGLDLAMTAAEVTLTGAPRLSEAHVDLAAGLVGGSLRAGGTVPELGIRPTLEQTLGWGDAFTAEGRFGFDPVVLTGREPWARWWPELAGTEISGGVGLSGENHYAGGAWSLGGAVLVQDLNIRRAAQQLGIEGVRGRLAWSGPRPWATAPEQTLTYQRVAFGAAELSNGTVTFAWTAPATLAVTRCAAVGFGGELTCAPFSVDWNRPDFATRLDLRGAQLAQLLRLVDDVPAEAVGAVDASLPVRWRDGRLSLGTGYLRLAPGESGRLHFTRDLQLLTSGRRPGSSEYKALRQLEQAMLDLVFDRLQVDTYPTDAAGQAARIRLVGLPSDGEHRMPIHLDVNINAPLEHFLNWRKPPPVR